MSLPLDSDGFLRRECPNCVQEFKWHHGPANEEAEAADEPAAYTCPLCGQPAGTDSWFTQAQLDFIEQASGPMVAQVVDDELDRVFRGLPSKHVKVKRIGRMNVAPQPDPMTEPDDMVIVASPCHAYEPVKVPEGHAGSLYCLVCGAAFAT
ncbi:MAG: hypothetical protein LCH77_09025 [Actinobacteria bacterium]|nr:hypothetical protein [Actinomycetota bacterium]